MREYRVISNGKEFRIEREETNFWGKVSWEEVGFDSTDTFGDKYKRSYKLRSFESAQQIINKCKEEEEPGLSKWKVVTE